MTHQDIPGLENLNCYPFTTRHGPADPDHESDRSAWTRIHTETGQSRGRKDYSQHMA